MTLNEKLNAIRKIIDIDCADDIESIMGKGNQLNGIIGLSAETKAQAKKSLEVARLKALTQLEDKKFSPTVMIRAIDSHCSDELAAYEYADRLNAAITHQIDYIRTRISYEKSERENERFNAVGC